MQIFQNNGRSCDATRIKINCVGCFRSMASLRLEKKLSKIQN